MNGNHMYLFCKHDQWSTNVGAGGGCPKQLDHIIIIIIIIIIILFIIIIIIIIIIFNTWRLPLFGNLDFDWWRLDVTQAGNDLRDPPITTIIPLELFNVRPVVDSSSNIEVFELFLAIFDCLH